MTVRLPDDVAAFVDNQVRDGAADSRAAAITEALRGELRRQAAQRDAEIYAEHNDTALDSLAAWSAHQPMDID